MNTENAPPQVVFLCLILSVAMAAAAYAEPVAEQFAIRDGDRVVIYGDSITAGAEYPGYPRYLEAYVRTRFPQWTTRFWNRGWSGDTAANLDRFKRDCLSLKPDVITINMGMNDAAYTPDIAPGLRAFVRHLTSMVELARQANPAVRLFLVSPILYESKALGTRSGYPYVLWSYSREERKLARRLNVGFIDLNREYGRTIGLADAMFPDDLVFSGDGVHPIPAGGHLFIAAHILKGLGAPDHLASLSMDAEAGHIASVTGQEAHLIRADASEFVFDRTLSALPFPVISTANGVTYLDRAVAFLECIAEDLNRDMLRITGLSAKAYRLSIDGRRIADLSAEELSDGVNLSGFFSTPDQEQAAQVCDAVGAKQLLQWRLWHSHLGKPTDGPDLVAEHREIDQAREKLRDLSRPCRHRVVLSALDQQIDRYQRHEQLLLLTGPSFIRVGSGVPKQQDIKVKIKNLSLVKRHVEIFWSEADVVPSPVILELRGEEEEELVFKATLKGDGNPPVMAARHYPVDLSFPAVVQRLMPALIPHLDVPRAAAPVNVDGDVSEWRGATAIKLNNRMMGAILARRKGQSDFGAMARVMWDSQYLYVAVEVTDQDHVNHFSDNRIGWDDAVILNAGTKQYVLALAANGPAIHPANASQSGVLFAVVRNEQMTWYEAAIPWPEISGKTPEPGTTHSFDITAADRDGDESHKVVNWCGSLATPRAGKIILR